MRTIGLTQGKKALVDDEDYDYLNQWKWYYRSDRRGGYASRNQNSSEYIKYSQRKTINMVWAIISRPKGLEVDHINGDKLDNRKINLRLVTRSQNLTNQQVYRRNNFGYKGIVKYGDRWLARIRVKNKLINLGVYKELKIAALAYNIGSIGYHGEFGSRNKL